MKVRLNPDPSVHTAKSARPDSASVVESADDLAPSILDQYHGYKRVAATQLPGPIPSQSYYDQAADLKQSQAYYAGLPTEGPERFAALRQRITRTHQPIAEGYDGALKVLYGSLDRHPDGVLRCVYSHTPVRLVTYPNIALDHLEGTDVAALAAASLGSPEVLGSWLAFQKGMPALNCEHVVPQDNFNRGEPMRSDLHHLFACDSKENSLRGNLLRYPDIKLPYTPRQVAGLKEWALAEPPDAHERHRNAEIQRLQGNRNPFIDHPEWVSEFPTGNR